VPSDRTDERRTGSLWDATLPDAARWSSTPLAGDTDADVAIVGAGLTGLWTAHSLLVADPTLRVVVLERETVGFGASGRNGGWCSALLPTSPVSLARTIGRDAAVRLQRAMHATVDEVCATVAAEGIDCDLERGGTLDLARSSLQVVRARRELDELAGLGFGEDDYRWLDASEASERCGATDVLGAAYTPHCAALHPAKLVHGLAHAVARRGATIHERTKVLELSPRRVVTTHGTVRAGVVVRATEAWSSEFRDARRDVIPIYSMMIATEPLREDQWDRIGLTQRETFGDGRHLIIYGQRTADGRLACGGRGAPYHFASRIDPAFDTDARVRDHLVRALRELFPVINHSQVTHHWGGPLGVPRDWRWSVRFDTTTGMAAAGGYVGDGVATANLAGRVIAELVTGRASDHLGDLALVNTGVRRWEPEPLRWLGVRGVGLAVARADVHEARTGRDSRLWGAVMAALLRR
jgi:glycine/D-amino acid oxidase-like deaminating enzyme